MDFCSILKLARVDVGNIVKRVKIWKLLLIEVFLLVGFLTELCLYICACHPFLSLFSFHEHLICHLSNKTIKNAPAKKGKSKWKNWFNNCLFKDSKKFCFGNASAWRALLEDNMASKCTILFSRLKYVISLWGKRVGR